MGIVGSCIFSSEWRAASGSVYSMIVLFSTIFIRYAYISVPLSGLKTIPQPLAGLSFYHLMGSFGILAPIAYVLALMALVRLRVGKFFP